MESAAALPISDGQLALSAGLILVNVVISTCLRLGLARSLLIAAGRMVIQLLLVGMALEWVFRQRNPWLVILMGLAMAVMASRAAVARTRGTFPGIYLNSFVSVLVSAALVTSVAIRGLIQPDPWFNPQYVIPLLGMVLGNILNGLSLGLDRFTESLRSGRREVEMRLCLGADRWHACRDVIREAIRVGMTPVINSMMVMGLVSLPGMMTGQILQGSPPANAVRYQIMIIFVIAAGTALGVCCVVLLGYLSLTTGDDQLRLDRLGTSMGVAQTSTAGR
jgi:putative ABC transport system permease protein